MVPVGQGKSAALGLAIAGAIGYGYSNIFVTAPSPENLKTVFEFVFKVGVCPGGLMGGIDGGTEGRKGSTRWGVGMDGWYWTSPTCHTPDVSSSLLLLVPASQ